MWLGVGEPGLGWSRQGRDRARRHAAESSGACEHPNHGHPNWSRHQVGKVVM